MWVGVGVGGKMNWRIRQTSAKVWVEVEAELGNIKTLLGLPRLHGCKDSISHQLNKKLNSLFDRFWLDEICCEKFGSDGLDHNKSRFYRTLKSSFTQEPYILDIPNRSQQAWLTRYQVSAVPNLGIESGRYTRPVTPVTSRLCKYCSSNSIDDENHAVLECNTFLLKRNKLGLSCAKLRASLIFSGLD